MPAFSDPRVKIKDFAYVVVYKENKYPVFVKSQSLGTSTVRGFFDLEQAYLYRVALEKQQLVETSKTEVEIFDLKELSNITMKLSKKITNYVKIEVFDKVKRVDLGPMTIYDARDVPN
jgi:hypothetical protein